MVEISGVLTNSPVNINQNQDGSQSITNTHIEYVIDEDTVHVFPQRRARKMRAVFVITIFVSILGIVADILGVLSYVGIQNRTVIVVLLSICLFVMLIAKKDLWLTSLKVDGSANFKDGLWYEKRSDGNFMSYIKKAKCIYPKCDGLVQIIPAPPRERPNHSVVGKCSIGGIRHTYTVDYNGIGYPHEFDWRPLDKKQK